MCILENEWLQAILTGLVSGILSSIIVTCYFRCKDREWEIYIFFQKIKFFSLKMSVQYRKIKDYKDAQFIQEMFDWISLNPMPTYFYEKYLKDKFKKKIVDDYIAQYVDLEKVIINKDKREVIEEKMKAFLTNLQITWL